MTIVLPKLPIKLKLQFIDNAAFQLTDYRAELESQEYDACRFVLNGKRIIYRSAKQTPKKIGQFVTFWKREVGGPIAPFDHDDPFDYFMVNARHAKRQGLFIIPKSEVIKRGIVSSSSKEGKRAFRVYPPWDQPTSAIAIKSQKWQLEFFFEVGVSDINKIEKSFV